MLKRTNYSFAITPNSQKTLSEILSFLNTLEHDILSARQELDKQNLRIEELSNKQASDIKIINLYYNKSKNNIEEVINNV